MELGGPKRGVARILGDPAICTCARQDLSEKRSHLSLMLVEKVTVLLAVCTLGLAGVVGFVHYSQYLYGPGGDGWRALYFVIDDSMSPTLNPGDAVVVQPVRLVNIAARYGTGDIVCFRQPDDPDRVVVSRAVEEAAGGLRTKGDNRLALDPWVVTDNEVIGRVVDVNPLTWRIVTVPLLSISVTGALVAMVVILGVRVLTQRKNGSPSRIEPR